MAAVFFRRKRVMDSFKKASRGDRVFYVVITVFLTLFFLVVLYPCVYVVSASISSGAALNASKVTLFPVGFTLDSYKLVLADSTVWLSYGMSLFYTITGTFLSVALTMCGGYVLSRDDLPGGKIFITLFIIPMFFGGGMIPNYLLVSKLKLINTIWAVILPPSLSAYNLIVARTFIRTSIPREMFDAANIDGASDLRYFISVVLPLSKAIIAVECLFFGVGRWNTYFTPMLYLTEKKLYPLSLVIRQYLILNKINVDKLMDQEKAEQALNLVAGMKYALIVISTVPVMMLYPFVQKHFAKGVMIGSIKG